MNGYKLDKGFTYWIAYDVVIWLDGLSLGALLFLHFKNFKEEEEWSNNDFQRNWLPYATIKLGEYEYCATEDLSETSEQD